MQNDIAEKIGRLAKINIAFERLAGATPGLPVCNSCLNDQENQRVRNSIASRMLAWAFERAPKSEIDQILNGVLSCALCQQRVQPGSPELRPLYEYLILVTRCWSTQGASPLEVQEVLNDIATPLGFVNDRFRWT